MRKILFLIFSLTFHLQVFAQKEAEFDDFQVSLDSTTNALQVRQKIKIRVNKSIDTEFLTAKYAGHIGDTIKIINPNNQRTIKVIISDSLKVKDKIVVSEKAYKALKFPGFGEFEILIEKKGVKDAFIETLISKKIKANAENYAAEQEEKPSNTILFILLGSTILLLILFLVFFNKNTKKKKQLLFAGEAQDKYQNIRTSRERLVAMVNQDLQKPLDTIINESAFAHNKEDIKAIKTDLKDIYQEGKRLKQTLENLESVYLYLAGNLKMQKLEHNLKETIQDVLQKFTMTIEEKKIIVHDLIPDEVFATFDRKSFMRLFEILIFQGISRTPEGASYIIKLQEQGSDALLSFQDTGIGIDSYDFQRLYKPFNELDAFSFVNKGQLGLSLTFCKIIVEIHESRLEVRTDEDKGTTYFFPIKINKVNKQTLNTQTKV